MVSYVCWIGNIPDDNDCKYYKQTFNELGKQFSNLTTCHVELNVKHKCYQCFLNYDLEDSAKKAVNYFNKRYLFGSKLSSMYRAPKKPRSQSTADLQRERIDSSDKDDDDDDDDDDNCSSNSDESDSKSVFSEDLNYNDSSKTILIKNSKFLRKQLQLMLKNLKDTYSDITYNLVLVPKFDFNCTINCSNWRNLSAAVNEIKKWRVRVKNINFDNDVKNQLTEWMTQSLQEDLTSFVQKNFKNVSIYINKKFKKITIRSFDKDTLFDAAGKIKSFCERRVVVRKEIKIEDIETFNSFEEFLGDSNFKRKFRIQNLKVELKKPTKRIPGKIIFTGKQTDFNNSNYQQLDKFEMHKETVVSDSKKLPIPFLRYKLNCYKGELKKKFIKLEFESDISGFTLCGDMDDMQDVLDEITGFINSAESVSISVKDKKYDLEKVKIKIEKFKREQNEETDNGNNGTLSGCDIHFDEKSKIIFINGTDKDEINEIKTNLTNLIDELIEKSVAVKIPVLIYAQLLQSNLMSSFKTSKTVKVFFKRNLDRMVRISGNLRETDQTKNSIIKYCELLSKQIRVNSLEMNKYQYSYLMSSKQELKNIESSKNVIICTESFERYASLKLSNVDIELLCGDLTKYPTDAYVNAANKQLCHAGGLAKVIADSAGSYVKKLCDEHVKKNGELNEGDVFVTDAGELGLKSNTYIIHAVGPTWTGGSNNEKDNLARSVRNCLIKAIEKSCESIVIPPISTGIFNYPFGDAVTIITNTVFDFISKSQSCLKKVIFMTNENDAAKKWEVVLNHQAISKNFKINTTSKFSLEASAWYWQDDEGKWKAFVDKYNSFIEAKHKEYEKTGFNASNATFDLKINEKNYLIDLKNKLQINKSTGYKHDISNQVPIVSQYYWTWLDERQNHSPLSEYNSNLVEEAYQQKRESIDMIVKKHSNDIDTPYRYAFAFNNEYVRNYLAGINQNADGIQINLLTKYKRLIFREMRKVTANIEYEDESGESEGERSKQIMIAGFDVDGAKNDIVGMLNNAKISEMMPHYDLPRDQIDILRSKYYCTIDVLNDSINISGMQEAVDKVKIEILQLNVQGHRVHYPKEWNSQSDDLHVVLLDENSQEYKKVHDAVAVTIPNPSLAKIERIQNKWLWKQYSHQMKTLKDKGISENEQWLFHGTRSLDPLQVYNDQVGFDMRFSNDGMWGRGIYFAVNASYSRSYIHPNSDGTSSMFYARVALGDAVQLPSNSSYRIPPEKPANERKKFAKERYDSIKGNTGGSDIYIVYENLRAYPEYLITFKKT